MANQADLEDVSDQARDDFIAKALHKSAQYRNEAVKEKSKRDAVREELMDEFGHSAAIVAAVGEMSSRTTVSTSIPDGNSANDVNNTPDVAVNMASINLPPAPDVSS